MTLVPAKLVSAFFGEDSLLRTHYLDCSLVFCEFRWIQISLTVMSRCQELLRLCFNIDKHYFEVITRMCLLSIVSNHGSHLGKSFLICIWVVTTSCIHSLLSQISRSGRVTLIGDFLHHLWSGNLNDTHQKCCGISIKFGKVDFSIIICLFFQKQVFYHYSLFNFLHRYEITRAILFKWLPFLK